MCAQLGGDRRRIRTALLAGSALPLAMFVSWDAVMLALTGVIAVPASIRDRLQLRQPRRSLVSKAGSLEAVAVGRRHKVNSAALKRVCTWLQGCPAPERSGNSRLAGLPSDGCSSVTLRSPMLIRVRRSDKLCYPARLVDESKYATRHPASVEPDADPRPAPLAEDGKLLSVYEYLNCHIHPLGHSHGAWRRPAGSAHGRG